MAYRGPVEYRIGSGWGGQTPKSFRKLSAAKKYAHREADRTGKTVRISKLWDVGEVDSYDIEPYKPASRIGGEFNPRRKNPSIEYGVVVIGSAALSKAGFKTKEQAKRYVGQLRTRGLLLGREYEILKIDNDAMRSERVNPGGLFDAIRPGSRVSIVNRFGQVHSGRAVMRGPAGWVLNMGGRYGTPDIATPENTVKVTAGRGRGAGNPVGIIARSKQAAQAFAKRLGLKRYSIRKVG